MTHEEAMRLAVDALISNNSRVMARGRARTIREQLDDAIAAYLEARGAVLCEREPEMMRARGKNVGDFWNFEPVSFAYKLRSKGMEVQVLHAALSDKGDAS